MSRLLRVATCTAAVLAFAGCGSTTTEASGSSTAAETTPQTIALTVTVVDQIPLQLATNKDDVDCYPSAATVGASTNGAQMPQITVRDAGGTIVGTADVSTSGSWGDDACTMTTLVGDVPTSDFYSLTLAGDGGIFKIESHKFERTVEADPVNGAIDVE